MTRTLKIKLINIDWLFIIAFLTIIAIGNYFLASASLKYFAVQLRWIALGMTVLLTTMYIGYEKLLKLAYPLYGLTIILLISVLFMRPHRGAHSWFDLPGFSIQPSEIAKISLVLILASHLRYKENQATYKGLLWPLALTLLPVSLILLQPDLGTAITLLPVFFIILFASGARKSHLFASILIGLSATIPMWMFLLKSYQKKRILAFINPELFEAREAYQMIMSTIAIGSGGWSGAGWGKGMSNTLGLLPDRHTDFIFVVVAEEGGLVTAGLMLLLFALLVFSGLSAAANTRDPGGRLVAIGATAMLGTQSIINIAVVEGLLPTTGITLPLVSYGGSSMLSAFLLLGLILSVGSRQPTVLHGETFRGKDALG